MLSSKRQRYDNFIHPRNDTLIKEKVACGSSEPQATSVYALSNSSRTRRISPSLFSALLERPSGLGKGQLGHCRRPSSQRDDPSVFLTASAGGSCRKRPWVLVVQYTKRVPALWQVLFFGRSEIIGFQGSKLYQGFAGSHQAVFTLLKCFILEINPYS